MPTQVLPITDLASVGLIEDMPSISLPPNAFSNVQNVRFHDNAIIKFPAETPALSNFMTTGDREIVYVAYWPSTEGDKYVVITDDQTSTEVTVYNPDGTIYTIGGIPLQDTLQENFQGSLINVTGGDWQHTLFNGGFHIIINNGNSTPRYIQADTADIIELPGWDSYASEEVIMDFEFDGNAGGSVDIAVALAAGTDIKVTCMPRNIATAVRSDTLIVNAGVDGFTPDGTLSGIGTADSVSPTGFRFVPGPTNGGNRYIITSVSLPITSVTAGVIRAYGNLLVAGNLRESNGRTLSGTIRTSDVAGPGQIPTNWNPFNLGVNTADEFTLASTGTIQDLVELQGVLYVYTDSSIHAIQQTGSPVVPFQISPVTDNFGADNVDSVLEVDGKHIVVGSNDIYIFAGHPGSIQSIADTRVRDAFRSTTGWKIVRLHAWDELWFWREGGDDSEAMIYIWNYRDNVWTKRLSPNLPVAIDSNQDDLVLATSGSIFNVNTITDPQLYLADAWIERRRMALAPEFDTETLASMALLIDGDDSVDITVVGTNSPGNEDELLIPRGSFNISDEYKQDIRTHGRFINYRLTHPTTGNMRLSGIQLDVAKGGTR